MAKKSSPEKVKKSTQTPVNTKDLTPPDETTMLQLKVPLTLKNDFKAHTAKSPFKTMSELFDACFREYKDNHPI